MANQDEKFRKTFNQDEKVRGLSQHTLFTFVPILESTATADFLFSLAQSYYDLIKYFRKEMELNMFSLFVCGPATQTSQKMHR